MAYKNSILENNHHTLLQELAEFNKARRFIGSECLDYVDQAVFFNEISNCAAGKWN